MSTTAATYTAPTAATTATTTTNADRRPVWKHGVAATAAAAVATTVVAAVASAAGVSFADHTGETIPVLAFPQLTVFFGLIGVAIAGLGVYGVIAYAVARRTREFGIRMALGAARGEILRLVLGKGLLLSGIGLVLGLAASFGLTRVLQSMLFAVTPNDPLTLAVVAGVIALVAVIACVTPALRATKVDPLVVLRQS